MVEVFTNALSSVFFSGRYEDVLGWLAGETVQDSSPGPVFYHEIHFAVPAFRMADRPNVVEFHDGLKKFIAKHMLEDLKVYGARSEAGS
jgi:hypothetical protein